jgi:glycosyltransferase involved in cell wall biosynthesis
MTRHLRALYCADTYPPQLNGVSVVTALSVQGLRERGWDVRVVSPSYPPIKDVFASALPGQGKCTGTHIASMPMPGYRDIRLAAPARGIVSRVMRDFKPDIVHSATEFMIGWMGQREAIRHGVPLVSSYHTDFSRYTVEYGVPWMRGSVQRYLGRFHRRSARVYTPGAVAVAELQALGIADVELWGRGVDTTLFHPTRRDQVLRDIYAPDGAFLLLHVGRLAAEKSVERILDGYARAKAVMPADRPIRLIVAGSGPRERQLREVAPFDVTFLGNLDRTTSLPQLYASADAFLFASHTETLGLVILEAMASGLPVIATPAGGVADHLRDKVNGIAFSQGDVAAMAAAIARLATDPTLHARLALGARATAAGMSWENEIDRLDASYREVVACQIRPWMPRG